MKIYSFQRSLITTVALLLACLILPVKPLCHDGERLALSQLKDSFTIDKSASRSPLAYPKVASWKAVQDQRDGGDDCCSWDGVKCDENTGHVIYLDLGSSFLYGSINSSSSLFNFSHLQRLNLADNHFNWSPLPPELGRLSKLTHLNLSSAYFTGQIPSEISLLSNLSSIDLSHAYIASEVPSFLANLTFLTQLVLKNCGLHGEFPNQIFQLPKLELLSVHDNPNVTGQLPEFHSGSPLKELWLGNTSFSGNIPSSIENLDSLEFLKVAKSKFSGIPPSSLGKLTRLTYLDLSYNNFSGQVPSFLQNLTQLTTLWFGGNQLTGEIPPWIADLTQLNILSFAKNKLSGPVPQSLSRLQNLRTLNLFQNDLTGRVDFDMFLNMTYLAELRLDYNKLSVLIEGTNNTKLTLPKFEILGLNLCNLSEFPDFLRYQDRLRYLDLGANNIHGRIPKWIWNASMETMAYLALNDNFLTVISPTVVDEELGDISPLFCNLSSLQLLDLSNNNLNGVLPQCLENPNNTLSVLNIRNNSFHGTIPRICSNNGSNLKMIDLSYNQFHGELPRSLENCVMLESLNLGNNQLLDIFPSWLGALPKLRLLTLRSNHLRGEIGANFSEFQSLRVIDLSNNNFTGELPSGYFQSWKSMKVVDSSNSTITYLKTQSSFEAVRRTWTLEYTYSTTITIKGEEVHYGKIQEGLVAVDFSNNKFEGEIPESIGSLQGLRVLNLSNNFLSGNIPSSLRTISKVESLDLSHNQLSGQIPQMLVELTFLAFFNVSNNHLTGLIPRGNQFDTFENSSYVGNLGLCGYPLSRKCGDWFPTGSTSTFADEEDSDSLLEFNWVVIAFGFGSGIVVGVIVENFVMTKKQELWLRKICWHIKAEARALRRMPRT